MTAKFSAASGWNDLVWIDLAGRPQVVRMPAADNVSPPQIDSSAVVAGHSPAGQGGGRRLLLFADPATARPDPFEPGVTVVLADIAEADGTPSPMCSRTALKRVLAAFADDGLVVVAAAELEFFLLGADGAPLYPEIEQYSITKGTQLEAILAPVRNDLPRAGIEVEASNPEYSGGQVEVNLRHGDALAAADQATLLRWYLRQIARRAGLDATFMAKPWTDQAGSGMHVHQSAWRDGRNIFADGTGGLSTTGRFYVAGLLQHMAELALFGSGTPNAYHRRAGYSFAPTAACWGWDNRTLAVRAITGTESATRVEQRDAAADCNIYLTMASQFAAGLAGLRAGKEPPEPTTGNAYARTDVPPLPRFFPEAYDALTGSALARDALGQATITAYLDMLAAENAVLAESSCDWERDRYLHSI